MNFLFFKESIENKEPPPGVSVYLKALWYDAKGAWDQAHTLIQGLEDLPAGRQDKKASRIHAYLHRKEGDMGNADYWYRRAGKSRPVVSLDKEWEEIVIALL